MRYDMAKVIVERPRLGGGMRYPRTRRIEGSRIPLEESRNHQGMRRPWMKGNAKNLNENLSPLRRFLQANVGRRWDKVYSEVCERINRDSAVQFHVWQHLMMDVCTDPHVVRGEVGGGWRNSFRYYRFYVDPRCGLLRENATWRSRWDFGKPEETKPVNRVRIDDSHEYRMIDGIWYELELANLTDGSRVYDMGLRAFYPDVTSGDLVRFYGRRVYAIRKRQLNSKEIHQILKPV
jgi:hypothetical protein